MLDEKLSDCFPWDPISCLEGKFLLCIDNVSRSGDFALVYLINKILRQENRVVLLCCNHSPSHYESVLKKLNLDVASYVRKGILSFLTLSDETSEKYKTMTWTELLAWGSSGFASTVDEYYFFIDDIDCMDILSSSHIETLKLLSLCVQACQNREKVKGVVVGGHQCASLTEFWNGKFVCNESTCLYNANSFQTIAEQYRNLLPCHLSTVEYCKYKADLCIETKGLDSGYSMEIHGIISIRTSNPENLPLSGKNATGRSLFKRELLYKALDSGVRVASKLR